MLITSELLLHFFSRFCSTKSESSLFSPSSLKNDKLVCGTKRRRLTHLLTCTHARIHAYTHNYLNGKIDINLLMYPVEFSANCFSFSRQKSETIDFRLPFLSLLLLLRKQTAARMNKALLFVDLWMLIKYMIIHKLLCDSNSGHFLSRPQ